MGWTFYIGVTLILGAVVWHVRLHRQASAPVVA
jgi:hypothetical protein